MEHLDFLDLSDDIDTVFRPFVEKDMGQQFRSLTDIPKLVKVEEEEKWVDYQVCVDVLLGKEHSIRSRTVPAIFGSRLRFRQRLSCTRCLIWEFGILLG